VFAGPALVKWNYLGWYLSLTEIAASSFYLLNREESPLRLKLKVSGRLRLIIRTLRVLAVLACLGSTLPIPVKAFLLAITDFYVWSESKRLGMASWTIKYSETSGWEIAKERGQFVQIRLLPSSRVSRFAVFLHFETLGASVLGTGKQAVLVMADALEADDFRRLSAKLVMTMRRQDDEPL
jgi:hypothetical protein